MKIKTVLLLGGALLLASSLFAQIQAAPTLGPTVAQPPMSEKDVIQELKKDGAAQLTKDVATRGVDFEMDADVEKRLRKAKATDEVIKAITAAGPKERAAAARASSLATGAGGLSEAESSDLRALQTELDPDRAITLAEAFEKKYPKSEGLSDAYAFEANAYMLKGDAAKIVEYSQKSLDLRKDNLMALGMLAYAIPTPQYTKLHPADEEKDLAAAEKYAMDALKAVEDYKKPADTPDAEFAKRKANFIADLHADLGMIYFDRARLGLMSVDAAQLAKADSEFKLAVSSTEHPDPRAYYRLGEVLRDEGKLDDAIAAFTKANELGEGVLKQYSQQQIDALQKAKAKSGAPPAKP